MIDVMTLPWPSLLAKIDAGGMAVTPPLLDAAECKSLKAFYDQPSLFRRKVIMARHGFGKGEYQYFANPLPDPIAAFRQQIYPHLAPLANTWAERLGDETRYPETLDGLLKVCAEKGQEHPTPLLLRYGPGDYNCLHQDIYGDAVFPLQMAVLLDRPNADFTGGRFVLTEQRPRMQSRAEVAEMEQGQAVIFATRHRPRQGARGYHRVTLRHGVSTIQSGQRYTLGIIFHNAET